MLHLENFFEKSFVLLLTTPNVCWIPQNVLTFINESYKIILLPVYI